MNRREVIGSVVAGVAGAIIASVGSVWAVSRELTTKSESREIAIHVVNESKNEVLQRLASLEAKMDLLLNQRSRDGH